MVKCNDCGAEYPNYENMQFCTRCGSNNLQKDEFNQQQQIMQQQPSIITSTGQEIQRPPKAKTSALEDITTVVSILIILFSNILPLMALVAFINMCYYVGKNSSFKGVNCNHSEYTIRMVVYIVAFCYCLFASTTFTYVITFK